MTEGMDESRKRMKLIRLADRSEFGWDTVESYKSDDLASDSDDEKKLKRAEAEAAKKRKKKADGAAARKRKFNFGYNRGYVSTPQSAPAGPSTFQPQAGPSGYGQFFRASQHGPKAYGTSRKCFACGKDGHIRAFCPYFTIAAREAALPLPGPKPESTGPKS